MDVQTSINVSANVPQEWYKQWLSYFSTVEALFAVICILLALWVGRVVATFFKEDARILLLCDLAVGLVAGLVAGNVFLHDPAPGFAIAGGVFLLAVAAVRWLHRCSAPQWQKNIGDVMQGKITESTCSKQS